MLPTRHILHQGRSIVLLGEIALYAALDRFRTPAAGLPELPGPELNVELPPRPADLIRDYVRHVGGDPASYRKIVPPHLFPQWGFPLAARTLRGLPYPLLKVLNGGCRLEVRAALPAGEPLVVSARLESIDDNGRRAVLQQRIVTGTRSVPEAIIGDLYAIVPLGRGQSDEQETDKKAASGQIAGQGGKPRRDDKSSQRVPQDARELAYWKLPAQAGLAFAMLTGDFNPVHWVRPYARAFGFRSTILHGFSTMARTFEGLARGVLAGDPSKLELLDVRFTRPLVLPARVGLYVAQNQVYVGDAPGGPAYLAGSFKTR